MPEDFGSVKLALKNMSEGQSLFVSRGEYRTEASKASNAISKASNDMSQRQSLFVSRGEYEYRTEASKASNASSKARSASSKSCGNARSTAERACWQSLYLLYLLYCALCHPRRVPHGGK